jgi:hypothetical protein
MRAVLAALATGLALAALPVSAAPAMPERASDYTLFCRTPENAKACADQMVERMWTLHWVRIFNPDQEGVTFCGPSVTGPDANRKIVSDVVAWIDKHPERAAQATQDAQDAALLALFPCPVPYAPYSK